MADEKTSTPLERAVPALLLVGVSALALTVSTTLPPAVQGVTDNGRTVELEAYQFGWKPTIIHVEAGRPITFKVSSKDVTHGFYVDGVENKWTIPPEGTVTVGPIVFEVPGKRKIRCSEFCGPLHPFMTADIVVEPAGL